MCLVLRFCWPCYIQSHFRRSKTFLLRQQYEESTRVNYSGKMRYWSRFVAEKAHRRPCFLDDQIAEHFICWLWEETTVAGEYASDILSAVTRAALRWNCTYTRGPVVTGLLRGLTKARPRQRRVKKPWTLYHNLYMAQFGTDFRDLTSMAKGAAVLLGYGGLMRGGEIARKSQFGVKLSRGQVQFVPAGRPVSLRHTLRDVFITLRKSKTNTAGRTELIYVSCLCHRQFCGEWAICPAHWLLEYTVLRDRFFGRRSSDFWLLCGNGRPVSVAMLGNYMRKCIRVMNRRLGLNMDPLHYTTHSLRVGGTLDRARNGDPGHSIETAGRWSSQIWRDTYISQDWRDLALLSGRSVRDLQSKVFNPFTDTGSRRTPRKKQ